MFYFIRGRKNELQKWNICGNISLQVYVTSLL